MRSIGRFGGLAASLLLCACSALQAPTLTARTALPGKTAEFPIYAQLQSGAQGWRFVQLSDQAPGSTLQLGPMKVTQMPQTKPAVRGLLGLATTRQRSSLEPLAGPLQGFRVEPLTMLGMYSVGLLVVVPGSVAGPLLALVSADPRYLAWVLPLYGNFGPRERAYEQAVRSASEADHLRSDWGVLQSHYDRYRQTQNSLQDQAAKDLAALRQRLQDIDRARDQRLRTRLLASLPMRFDNQSGWPAPADSLLAAHLRIKAVHPMVHPQLSLDLAWPGLFPAPDVASFRQRLKRAELMAANAPTQLELQAQAEARRVDDEQAKAEQDNGLIDLDNDALTEPLAGWQYLLPTIPGGSLMMQGGQVSNLSCFCVVLKARQFFHILPQHFAISDSHIQLDWQGSALVLKNIGAQTVELDDLRIAEDRQSAVADPSVLSENAELRPGQVRRIALLNMFDGGSYTVSHEQAQAIQVELAAQLHYHLEGSSTAVSLAGDRPTPLLDLLPSS